MCASAKSPKVNIDELLGQMTLTEMVSLLSGKDTSHTVGLPRLGIPEMVMYDGPHGVRVDTPTTMFPPGVALGATWNVELLDQVGKVLGAEARFHNFSVLLGPCVNIIRHPLGGRNFETFSEDPCHAGEIGVAYVKGLQSQGVGASIKHFACNNQEIRRDRASSQVDERTMREIYLPQFEAIVKQANPWTFMSSYNRINGEYASQSRHLLTEILRDEWGFDGIVMSDWGGNHTTIDSVRAGLDLEMPGPAKYFGSLLAEAVSNWQIEPAVVKQATRRMLKLLERTGNLDKARNKAGAVNTSAHQAVARAVAEESIVLLKNENDTLPLRAGKLKSVALIGPLADVVSVGGGSSKNKPPYSITPLQGLQKSLGQNVAIEVEKGCECYFDVPLAPLGWVQSGMMDKGGPQGAEWVPASATNVQAGQEGKVGWKVEYFDNLAFAGKPVATVVSPKLHFWRFGSPPVQQVKWDQYSARWSTTLTVPHTGMYRMELLCSPNSIVRMHVNGKMVAEYAAKIGSDEVPMALAQLELVGGKGNKFVAEYVKLPSQEAAYVQLRFIPMQASGYEATVQKAAELAARCDVAIVCIGLPEDHESEGQDRPDLKLPNAQAQLVEAVAKANPRTIVVVQTGSPVVMPWLDDVPAVVLAWYPGMEGGQAIANVLTGKVNPSGKMPVTFPARMEDTPAFGHYPGGREVHYGEGIFVGYRHYDYRDIKPLFEFGYGLSYTQFEYSQLQVPSAIKRGQALKILMTLRNSGKVAGAEVVQLYVRDVQSSLPRPVKELKAFAKVFLKPGQSKQVQFELDERALSFYDPHTSSWTAEAGKFEILVGSSSRDIRLARTFDLK